MIFYLTKRRSKKNGKIYTALVAQKRTDDKEFYVTFDRFAINQIAKIQGIKLSDIKEGDCWELKL